MADVGMIDIRHIPYADIFSTDEYIIFANITAYSGQPLYTDSVILNYKINSGAYTSVVMNNTDSNYYVASIPQQNNGDVISYYIHAADESGRSVDNPYIGEADPHTFLIGDPLVPFISTSESLLDFGGTTGASIELTYDITAENLTENITLTLADGNVYEISEDGINYSNTIELAQLNGSVNTTIHVKFEPTEAGVFEDSILHSSVGANDKYLNLTGESSIGVFEAISKNIQISPNPSNGLIFVNGIENAEVQVFNTAGQMIANQQISKNQNTLDISNQMNGVYFVKIKTNLGTITRKVVKY